MKKNILTILILLILIPAETLALCWTPNSSFIRQICWSKKETYVNLQGRKYLYCYIPHNRIREWRLAESPGRYYNYWIKGRYRASHGGTGWYCP